MRVIIDCTEVFMETSSSLVVQACLHSNYKHHCTVKVLVAIILNGALSWIPPNLWWSTFNVYVVQDSGFFDLLEPGDQVMADRGFKIKTDLSAAKGNQIPSSDKKKHRICKRQNIC